MPATSRGAWRSTGVGIVGPRLRRGVGNEKERVSRDHLMGASNSKASVPGGLTHERLYQLTGDTRAIMNMILEFMMKEVTVKDFLALSNPAECKKYVLFMANALHRQFYELQIQPVREKGGVIAFRSIRDLAAPSAEEDREKQSLCLVLAYYYTRIFQIYGALALTLIDDIGTMRQMGILTGQPGQGLVAPGIRPKFFGRGGALTAGDLGRFAFLLPFLKDEKTSYGYRAKYVERKGLDGVVFFKIISGDAESTTAGTPSLAVPVLSGDKGLFTFYYEGAKNIAQMEVRVEKVTATGAATGAATSLYGSVPAASALRVSFMNYQYVPRGETGFVREEIPSSYLSKTPIPLLYPVTTGNGQIVYGFRDTTQSLNEILVEVMYRILRYTKTRVEEGRRLTEVPTGALPSGYGSTVVGTTTRAEVLQALSTSEENTVEPLRLAKILQNLQNTKPYGHCIARALQLLDTAPFPEQKEAVTHICKAKFLEVPGVSEKGTSTRYSRSGIPEPGAELTTSPGMLALSQLFYDTIAIGTPKLDISQRPGPNGKSSLEQYVEFMRRMATHFGDNRKDGTTVERSNDDLKAAGLKGIKNRRDQQFCREFAKDYPGGDMTIPIELAQKVYGVVQHLFRIQLEHSARCGLIFKQLFDIQSDRGSGGVKIALHPQLLQKGLTEINRLNFIARDLLMKYYTRCEEEYMRGVKMVVDDKRERQATAMAAAEKRTGVTNFLQTVGPAPPAPAAAPAAAAALKSIRMPRPRTIVDRPIAPPAAPAPAPARPIGDPVGNLQRMVATNPQPRQNTTKKVVRFTAPPS